MLLLEHKPLFTRKRTRVISIAQNYEKWGDGLYWMAHVECDCVRCNAGTGPGSDFYDVDERGRLFPPGVKSFNYVNEPDDHPANIVLDNWFSEYRHAAS